jgi:outer membrane receptor protein involved in Fe transport
MMLSNPFGGIPLCPRVMRLRLSDIPAPVSRLLLCVACALSFPSVARAQQPSSSPSPAARVASGEIHGRIVDAASGSGVGVGSVAVLRPSDSTVVAGAQPDSSGAFHISRIAPGTYLVRVRVIGFAPVLRPGVVISAEQPTVDLGNVALSQVATQLGQQQVTAERPDVTFAPDRNIYSTKNMATTSGGTAIDVLRNVPAVEVDATNKVSLRGDQNVVVQINGRPSPLKGDQLGNFLAQLPAKTVKNIEVSTNPSAKNDPEGAAGIINIVLDQEVDTGWSGGFNTATGTTGQANFSGNVGHQTGPLKVFLSYGIYHNQQTQFGSADQTNLALTSPAFVNSRLNGTGQPLWQNATFRSEYRLTEHDAISADAMLSGGNFWRDNGSYTSDLSQGDTVIGLFDQFNNNRSRSIYQDYVVGYHRTGDAKSATLSSELRLTQSSNSGLSDLFGTVKQGTAATGAIAIPTEHDVSNGGNPSTILQTDYTKPFGDATKLESGFKEILRHTTSDFTAAYLDSTSGNYFIVPSRSVDLDYREQLGSAYAVLSRRFGKVQTQAGLRLEDAATALFLPTAPAAQQRVDNDYLSAFPSGVLAYNFTPMRQLKLSYSRRISRPNAYQLDPVVQKQDARDYFVGNPNLAAQYTDAIELAYQETKGWGTIQLNPFLRNTAHAVRYLQTVDSSGVTTSTYANVASTVQEGVDLNVTYRHGPLTLFTGGNAYHYSSNATNLPGNLSTQAFVWSTRLNASWKLTPTLDVQYQTNYRSKLATEYGYQDAFVFMNFALRQKLYGDKGSVTLRVQDPFNMMTFGSITRNGTILQSNVQNFGQRGVFISFSRNFGQDIKLRPRTTEDQQPSPP